MAGEVIRAVVRTLHTDEPTPPPPGLWQRITDEPADEPDPLPKDRRLPDGSAAGHAHLDGDTPAPPEAASADGPRWFADSRGRRRRPRESLALAASAALIADGLLPAGGEATFDLPPNLDLADYPVVDVSLQQYNGFPEHSGDRVVRGTLPG